MTSQSPREESGAGTGTAAAADGINGSSGSNTGGDMGRASTADADKGGRLTEEEKKQNHIASEQKRRTAIREGFDRLSNLVPGLEGQARSEALVLRGTVNYMIEKLEERRRLVMECDARGIPVDPQLRSDIQRLIHWEEYKRNKGDSSEASSDDKKLLGPGPKKRNPSTSTSTF